MRIPYTGPLPPPLITPKYANTLNGARHALSNFLSASTAAAKTVLLTGAGISVASGLADYRGTGGTYTLNKTYRPIYYNEFVSNHEARKRYWARSFLGWTNLNRARPNIAHESVKRLGAMGLVDCVITQSECEKDSVRGLKETSWLTYRLEIDVDSFHSMAHPDLPTIELHGYLRSLVCIHCHNEWSRAEFQKSLTLLNPTWASFLEEMLAVGALDSENPAERRAKGLKSNPDGDVDVPNAPYTTFRYPACPHCLKNPPVTVTGERARVEVDPDGAWSLDSTAGVLKPAVVMFGESINAITKDAAEDAINSAGRVLVIGSSLATYSAWRLVKKAKEQRKAIGILNLGGVRGEESFYNDIPSNNDGEMGMRCNESADSLLPLVVESLRNSSETDLRKSYSTTLG